METSGGAFNLELIYMSLLCFSYCYLVEMGKCEPHVFQDQLSILFTILLCLWFNKLDILI